MPTATTPTRGSREASRASSARSVSFNMTPMPPASASPATAVTTTVTALASPQRGGAARSSRAYTVSATNSPPSSPGQGERPAFRAGGRRSVETLPSFRPSTHTTTSASAPSSASKSPRARTSHSAGSSPVRTARNSTVVRLAQPTSRSSRARTATEPPRHWHDTASLGRLPGEIPRWSLSSRTSVESSGYGYGRVKRVTVSAPKPELTEEELEAQRQEEERQRLEAEAAREARHRQLAEEQRELRVQVAELNRKVIARLCVKQWRSVVNRERQIGPQALPESEKAFCAMPEAKLATPKDATVAFLLSTFKYKKDRSVGERMLTAVVHPDHLAGSMDASHDEADDEEAASAGRTSTAGKRKLRKATRLRLQGLGSHTLASYVKGSSPENGYAIDPDAVTIEFNLLLSSPKCGKPGDAAEGDTSTVHVVTSGALPPTRAVHLTFHKGQWKVHDFSNLCTNVVPPVAHGAEEDGRIRAANLINGVNRRNPMDRGFVEGHMRIFDTSGKVIGYEKTRSSLQRPRKSLERLAKTEFPTGYVRPPQYYRSKHHSFNLDGPVDVDRHERARASTRSRAEELAAHDFGREWLDNPSLARRVVTGEQPSGKMAELIQKMRSNGMVVYQHVHTWRTAASLATRAHKMHLNDACDDDKVTSQQSSPSAQKFQLTA